MDNIALILQRVTFKTLPESIRAGKRIDLLQTQIETEYPQECQEFNELANGNLAFLLTLTQDIEFQFQGDEGDALASFRQFWIDYKAANGAGLDLAVNWYLDTHRSIISAWLQHIMNQRDVIKHDLTPPEYRNPAERDALADPESPLAEK